MDEYPEDDYDTDAEQERKAEDQTEHWRETGRCPSCGSRQPNMHPAVSGGGEVTHLCNNKFHKSQDISDTPMPQNHADYF